MFDEIRYELNGVEIDRKHRNIGVTTTIKNDISMTYDKVLRWTLDGTLDIEWRKNTHFSRVAQHAVGLLRKLQTRDCQRSP